MLCWALPLCITLTFITSLAFHQVPFVNLEKNLHSVPSLAWIFSSYIDVLLFCNVLQSVLRRIGLAKWVAIPLQAAFYSTIWFLTIHSIPIAISVFAVGLCNGWLVHQFRSLWPAWILLAAWHICIL